MRSAGEREQSHKKRFFASASLALTPILAWYAGETALHSWANLYSAAGGKSSASTGQRTLGTTTGGYVDHTPRTYEAAVIMGGGCSSTAATQPGPAHSAPIVQQTGVVQQPIVRVVPPITTLNVGHALQVAPSLKRVFMGLGWGAHQQRSIDIDASCILFSQGSCVDGVSFAKLHQGVPPICSVVHTGDVLTGQKKESTGLCDQERMYVWAERLPATVDCLVFVCNIYTPNTSFNDLSEAYIRMVNADTNQEIGRLSLAGNSLQNNADQMIFGKMYRYGGQWQFMGLGMPLQSSSKDGRTWRSLLPAIHKSGCALPPLSLSTANTVPNSKPQQPTAVKRSPKIARASPAGILAATAIFAGAALSFSMLESDLFESGVDFVNLDAVTVGMPEVPLGDGFEWAGDAAGGAAGAIGDAAGDAGSALGSLVGNAGQMAEQAVEAAGKLAGDMGEKITAVAGNAGETLAGLGSGIVSGGESAMNTIRNSEAGGCALEGAGNLASGAGEVVCAVGEGALKAVVVVVGGAVSVVL